MRLVIVVSVFLSNRQPVVIIVSGIRLFAVMLVPMIPVPVIGMPGTLAFMFIVLRDTAFDDMPMLTGMSVMRATSENRMQQHRRHRQNAGQGLKHEVFTALQTQSRR